MLRQRWTNCLAFAWTISFCFQVVLIVYKTLYSHIAWGYFMTYVMFGFAFFLFWMPFIHFAIYDSARNMYILWVIILLLQIAATIVAIVLPPTSWDKFVSAAPGFPACIAAISMEIIWRRHLRMANAYEEIE